MSYSKYGLTKINASSANHKKGIIQAPDGSYYQIDNFVDGKSEGLDNYKGKVFNSSLEADGRAAGFDPTTFNTPSDVENALKAISGENSSNTPTSKPTEYSPQLAHAKARVQQHEEDIVTGKYTSDLYDMDYRPDGAQSFLNRYKEKLGTQLENGNYHEKLYSENVNEKRHQATTNSSKVASGANDNSVDASYYARTGQDNRIRR